MGLIYIVVVALLAFSIISAPMAAEASEDEKKDSDIITRDFSFRVGEGVRIGDYRVELTNVVSVMDGLVEVKVWKRASQFEDWRVMESRRDVNLDGGQDRGGLTLMVTEIFDRDTVRMRATYRSDYGYPEKYITERALVPASIPKLEVSTSADNPAVRSGDEVKVTIIVRNVGNDTARDVALQDMPAPPPVQICRGIPPQDKKPAPARRVRHRHLLDGGGHRGGGDDPCDVGEVRRLQGDDLHRELVFGQG